VPGGLAYQELRGLKKILFIVNPTSARGRTIRLWATARPELARLGVEVTEHVTTHAGQATEITRRALNREFNCVIAVGGDGTLNEVVNGYLNETGQAVNSSAILGLLPSGTGSDFGRSLGFLK